MSVESSLEVRLLLDAEAMELAQALAEAGGADGGIDKTSSSCQPDWICPGLSLSRISPLDGAELSGEVLQVAGSDATYFSGTLLGSHPMA